MSRRVAKYRNVPLVVDGVRFASQAEGRRYEILRMMLKAGVIQAINLQPRYDLGCPVSHYVADFRIYCEGEELCRQFVGVASGGWVEDVKGVETPKFRHDVRLWKLNGPLPLVILRDPRAHGRIILPPAWR